MDLEHVPLEIDRLHLRGTESIEDGLRFVLHSGLYSR